MRWFLAVLLWTVSAVSFGQDATEPNKIDGAIKLGLEFLAKDAVKWNQEHNCASCHHSSLVIWSMREAKRAGFAIDEPVLAELTKMATESGDGKFGLDRPPEAPDAASPKAMYFALALGQDPQPDDATRQAITRFLGTVKSEQTQNGSWTVWPNTRPPIFGKSKESLTLLASLALLPTAASGDAEAKAALDLSTKWLSETKTDDDPQSNALRLILWKKLDRPEAELAPLVAGIRQRQQSDGGWRQTPEMANDAWATGQALFSLGYAGVDPHDPAIVAGREFLAKTQQPDGSWIMQSRPTSVGGEGATSLIPITGGGSAWAVLGLVRTARK